MLCTHSPAHVQRFLRFKPLTSSLRINEALSLRWPQIDLDNLLVTIDAKGKKQRVVPVSLEMRRALFRHLSRDRATIPVCTVPQSNGGPVFSTRDGRPLSQRNVLRDLKTLAARIGATGVRVSPHTVTRLPRTTFATAVTSSGFNEFLGIRPW